MGAPGTYNNGAGGRGAMRARDSLRVAAPGALARHLAQHSAKDRHGLHRLRRRDGRPLDRPRP